MSTEFICPICGTEVPAKARACPECGSDETTGWSARAQEELGFEEAEEFDYDRWKEKEFGPARPSIGWWWWCVAVLALLMFIWMVFK